MAYSVTDSSIINSTAALRALLRAINVLRCLFENKEDDKIGKLMIDKIVKEYVAILPED